MLPGIKELRYSNQELKVTLGLQGALNSLSNVFWRGWCCLTSCGKGFAKKMY